MIEAIGKFNRTEIDKSEIVDALIALGKDDEFFGILEAQGNEKIKRRYDAYQKIKLDDPDTKAVLEALSVSKEQIIAAIP